MKAIDSIIISAITILGLFLQVKYQPQNVSPFDTHYTTMIFLLIALTIYVFACIIEEEIAGSGSAMIVSKLSFFSGTLASTLLMQILVPVLGWLIFIFWAIFFIKIVLIEFLRILVLRHVLSLVFSLFNRRERARARATLGGLVQEQSRLPPA